MQLPPVLPDESERIAALHRLAILDTPAEDRFDRLTRLAMRAFDVPIASISLIDTNRQWFKSCGGISVCETSRDISFCAHAIAFDEILYVENAHKDERFRDNPLVVHEPKIRFYAGCPLSVNGYKMGTFCIIDRKPRSFSDEDRRLLRDLANMASELMAASQPEGLEN
ncbi:MAG TPA: GAF domain-containing protein [Terracidiphilus sp.]|nr:GAF domain-containing protein [Terracidiphilus sp.]